MIIETNAVWVARCREIIKLIESCVDEYEDQMDDEFPAPSSLQAGSRMPPLREIFQHFSAAHALNTRQYELIAVAACRASQTLDLIEKRSTNPISRFEFICALDEIALHCRKLVESLLLRLAFDSTNNAPELYELYSAVCRRDSLNRQQQELSGTFGQTSAPISLRASALNTEVNSKAPPLSSQNLLPLMRRNDARWELKSTEALFKDLIGEATDLEIFALGLSYQGMFGHTSTHVHFSPTRRPFAQVDFSYLAQSLEEVLLLMIVNLLRLSSFVYETSKPVQHQLLHEGFDTFSSGRIEAALAGPAIKDDIVLVRVGDSRRPARVLRVFTKQIDPSRTWNHISYELEAIGAGPVLSVVASRTNVLVHGNRIPEFLAEARAEGFLEPGSTVISIDQALISILQQQPASEQFILKHLRDSNLSASIFAE